MPTPTPSRRPTLDAARRRALVLLASSPAGARETILVANGYAPELLAELVWEGLATKQTERMRAGVRVVRLWITDAGRQAPISGAIADGAERDEPT